MNKDTEKEVARIITEGFVYQLKNTPQTLERSKIINEYLAIMKDLGIIIQPMVITCSSPKIKLDSEVK